MSDDEFHETVSVILPLGRSCSAGELNRCLKGLGATLFYDVYSFMRTDKHPDWQSEQYCSVRLYADDQSVQAQGPCDTVELRFPLASIEESFVPQFADTVFEVANALEAAPELLGQVIAKEQLLAHCQSLVDDLWENWAEKPGGFELSRLIDESYPRRGG